MTEEILRACEQQAEAIRLYLWEELDDDACDALELHLESCAACRAAVESERQLLAVLHAAAPAAPPVELLAQCRMQLSEKLEHSAMPGFWTRLATVVWPRGWNWSLRGWMTAHPALSAAALVLAGISLGAVLPRLASGPENPTFMQDSQTGTVVRVAGDALPASDFSVTGLDVTEGASGPLIVFRGRREATEEWSGQPSDPRVRGVLMDVIQNPRFTADARLKSVEALQTLASDQEVRRALCEVARRDRNPAVRLRAIESLKGLGQDEMVQETILEALLQDANPGVRIEAMNALRDLVENTPAPDRKLVRVLRERMQNDANTYIRVQSAAAVRSLEQRGVY